MTNNKEILATARRFRNIEGCIIAEVEGGYRTEVNPEIIEGLINFIDSVNDFDKMGVEEANAFLLKQRLINLLEINGFEMILR